MNCVLTGILDVAPYLTDLLWTNVLESSSPSSFWNCYWQACIFVTWFILVLFFSLYCHFWWSTNVRVSFKTWIFTGGKMNFKLIFFFFQIQLLNNNYRLFHFTLWVKCGSMILLECLVFDFTHEMNRTVIFLQDVS